MIVGKAHNGKRGHGVRAARFAVFDESLKLGEPFAETRIAAAVRVRIVLRYGGVEKGGKDESGFLANPRHCVRWGGVQTFQNQTIIGFLGLFFWDGGGGLFKKRGG